MFFRDLNQLLDRQTIKEGTINLGQRNMLPHIKDLQFQIYISERDYRKKISDEI